MHGPRELLANSEKGKGHGAAKDPGDFTLRVKKRLESAYPEKKIQVRGHLDLVVIDTDGARTHARLNNLNKECKNHPESCELYIKKYIRIFNLTPITGKPIEKNSILPLIKDRVYISSFTFIGGDSSRNRSYSHMVPFRPFIGDLYIIYVEELEDRLRLITNGEVKLLGLDNNTLYSLALENLKKRYAHLKPAGLRGTPLKHTDAIKILKTEDNLAASLLLLPELWKNTAKDVRGDLIVVAPTRDYLLYTGLEQKSALRLMRELARRMLLRRQHPLSATLLRLAGGEWKVYRP